MSILPGPVHPWTPHAEDVQFLELVHRSTEEARGDEHQKDGGAAHEPIHAHLVSAGFQDLGSRFPKIMRIISYLSGMDHQV